jgi:ribosome biogenesis GTPase
MDVEDGLVTRCQSGFYTVVTAPDQPALTCRLRGRLKHRHGDGDILAIGDRVSVARLTDGSGVIEQIYPQERALVRLAPTPKGLYRQVLLANLDQVLFIFACADPEPHLRMLDRFLVVSEKQVIPALIVANKVDLVGLDQARATFGHYAPLGYPVIYTSAKTGLGLNQLRDLLIGKLSGFSGPSGAGKSSLLNAIQPGLGLAVSDVSESTGRGRHTTTVRELFPIRDGGYVADTPGIKALALWDTEPEELDGYFPELRDLVSSCQFNDCTHRSEPGCAVQAAVKEGKVNTQRYESYLRLRYGDE